MSNDKKIFIVGYDDSEINCAFTTREKAQDYVEKNLFIYGYEFEIYEYDLDKEIILTDEQNEKFKFRNNKFSISYDWVQCELKLDRMNYTIREVGLYESNFKTYIEVIAKDLKEALEMAKNKMAEYYSDSPCPIDNIDGGFKLYRAIESNGVMQIKYARVVYDNKFDEPFFSELENVNSVFLACNNARHAIHKASKLLGKFKGEKLDYPKKCLFS